MTLSNDVLYTLEQSRNSSACNISALQAGLLPILIDTKWRIVDSYPIDNQWKYVMTQNDIFIKVSDIKFTIPDIKKKKYMVFEENMLDAYNSGKIHPMLLFINNKFVKWSNITIVRDYRDYYFIVRDIYTDPDQIKKVDLVIIPFEAKYSEDGSYDGNETQIFRFNHYGELSISGTTIITTGNPKLYYHSNHILGSHIRPDIELPIEDTYRLNKSNVLIFKDNMLYTECPVSFKSLNLFNINNGNPISGDITYKVFYNKFSNPNISNVTIPTNRSLVKNALKGNNTLSRLDMNKLDTDFNFEFDKNKDYEQNTQDGLKYIMSYNESLMNDVYHQRSSIETQTIKGYEIKNLVKNNNLKMLRLKYKRKDTFVMVFLNGEIYKYYSDIQYDANTFSIPIIDEIDNEDVFEFVYFKDVENYTSPITVTEGYTSVTNLPIEPENLILLTNDPYKNKYKVPINDNTQYLVNYSMDKNVIRLENSYYYNKPLLMASKNQFRYVFYNISELSNSIKLTSDFKACLNPDRYLVFINGRFINKVLYKLLIEDHGNPYVEPSIYSKILLNPGDKIEVFYLPTSMIYTKTGFKMVMDSRKTIATTNDQKVFKIPYPYKNKVGNKNDFIVYVGSVFVDPRRYNIINNGTDIEFIDEEDYLDKDYEVTFIFLYTILEDYANQVLGEADYLRLISRNVVATIDRQSIFDIPQECNNSFIISVGSTFVNPTDYTIENNKLKFVNEENYIDIGRTVTFISLYSDVEDEYIELKVKQSIATVDRQSVFDIPCKYTDGFIATIGGTFIDDRRYKIVANQMVITDETYFVDKGRSIFFIYTDSYDDEKHVKFNYWKTITTEQNQLLFGLPYLYNEYNYNKDSFLVNIGTTYINTDRYSIINNEQVKLNSSESIDIGRTVSFIFAYKEFNKYTDIIYDTDENNKIIFDVRPVEAVFDRQMKFEIPAIEDPTMLPLTKGDYCVDMITKTIYVDSNGQTLFNIPQECIGNSFVISIGSVFVENSRYELLGDTQIQFEPDIQFSKDESISFIMAYNRVKEEYIKLETVTVDAVVDKQRAFIVPNTFVNSVLPILGTTFVDPDRYFVLGNEIILLDPDEYVDIGSGMTFLYVYNYDEEKHIRFNMKSVAATEEKQRIFKIPFEYVSDNFIVSVGSVFIEPSRYIVSNGSIEFVDKDDYLDPGGSVSFIIMHRDYNRKGRENIEFYITSGDTFYDEDRYEVNTFYNFIKLKDQYDAVDLGNELTFTFAYCLNLTRVRKKQEIIEITKDTDYLKVPVPFPNYLDIINNKFMLFINTVYVDEDRYFLDRDQKMIKLIDDEIKLHNGERATFLFFYLDKDNTVISYLEKHGYIYTSRLKNIFSKKLYFLFVNGKKVDLNSILDISRGVLKITKDIHTRFNVCLLDFCPVVDELKDFVTTNSSWGNVIGKMLYPDTNALFDTYNEISDTEPNIVNNISEYDILNDIIRDVYMVNGINTGDDFKYLYEKGIYGDLDINTTGEEVPDDSEIRYPSTVFTGKDSKGTYILETQDANKSNSPLKNITSDKEEM